MVCIGESGWKQTYIETDLHKNWNQIRSFNVYVYIANRSMTALSVHEISTSMFLLFLNY